MPPINTPVHPNEQFYFAICLVISLPIYLLLLVSVVGVLELIPIAIILLILHGLSIGHIRANGIRVSEQQFPEVDRLARHVAGQVGLTPPAIYILQSGGLLNAFATRFLGRNYVVIYSDLLELAYAQGEAELAFVIGHEMGHIRRRHLTRQLLIAPGRAVPFLGKAYSRACEYTCDRIGAYFRPDGAPGGLMVLAAGKTLYRRVNGQSLIRQAAEDRGFWVWLAEILSTHPPLPKRIQALASLGVPVPAQRDGLLTPAAAEAPSA